jgi:transcriptional regulator with XRE-family HTH domain
MISGRLIRAGRALAGLTGDELAKLAGISATALNNVETGPSDPKASTLAAIVRALGEAGVAVTNGDEPGVKLKAKR